MVIKYINSFMYKASSAPGYDGNLGWDWLFYTGKKENSHYDLLQGMSY
jgi:hypothetical protein